MIKHIYFLIITIIYFMIFLCGISFSIVFLRFSKIPKIIETLGRITEEAKGVIYRNKKIPFDDEQDSL